MTINERIRAFRKDYLRINQTEFASKLGITQGGFSYLEQPNSSIQDSMIKLICSTFGLAEQWLRTGKGEMFAGKTPEEKIEDALREKKVEPLSIELVMAYIDLPADQRKSVLEFFESYHKKRVAIEGEQSPEELKASRSSPSANRWAAEFKKERLARNKLRKEEFLESLQAQEQEQAESAAGGGDGEANG